MYTAQPFRKAKTTNATDASFPARIPTVTEPSADGVITLADELGLVVPCVMFIVPYGTGADGDTFDVQVIGWRRTLGLTKALWIPVPLLELACTLSTVVGVAGADVIETERFADTLSVTLEAVSTADVTNTGHAKVTSPADNTIAHAEYEVEGYEKIEFIFDLGGTTTGANALVALHTLK